MRNPPDRRRLLRSAIGKVGADALPSKSLEGTFKHEGDRHWFSTLKHTEEESLLRAVLRHDTFGNVTAGGPDTIAAILDDEDEAKEIARTFASHVRITFRLPSATVSPEPRRGFWRWGK